MNYVLVSHFQPRRTLAELQVCLADLIPHLISVVFIPECTDEELSGTVQDVYDKYELLQTTRDTQNSPLIRRTSIRRTLIGDSSISHIDVQEAVEDASTKADASGSATHRRRWRISIRGRSRPTWLQRTSEA